MTVFLPRLFYLLAALAWYLLLWPNQVTIFMAACFSCLTLPYYRNLRRKTIAWRIRLERKRPDTLTHRLLLKFSHHAALFAYIATIISAFFVPIATLALLVSPQAAAGLARLRELQANNFQMPPDWVQHIQQWRMSLAQYPRVEKVVNDFLHNLDTLFADTMSVLLSRGFEVLGGTMTAVWITFLFLTLTVVFTVYARRIRKITGRIFDLPQSLLSRFICAIHKALRAILLGIVLVALAQGVLCGIGFAVAGINQPAFWGMLATLVAPIPVVGTALIWLPLCLSLWFTGNAMAAVGLGLWGSLAVAGVDNVLRPLFLRQGIKAPFFVLILAILCGLASFGPVGLIAGPVLLAFAIQAVEEANHFYQLHAQR